MTKRKFPGRGYDWQEKPGPRPKSAAPRGCSITTVLAVLIIAVLGMIGLVGYMYMKDSNWVGKRNIQLDNKTKGSQGFSEDGSPLTPLFTRRSNEKGRLSEKSAPLDELIQKVIGERDAKTGPEETAPPVVKKAVPAVNPAVKKTATQTVKTSPTVQKKSPDTVVKKTATTPKSTATTTAPKPRDVRIYFITYDKADDSVVLAPVTRRLAATEQPLEDTLKTLLRGTTSDEEDRQYSSAIPGGVTVRGIRVAGGIATIDLSANFEDGTGKKMMQARVYQLIYTATQYSTVTKVQVLLNGKTDIDFGGEGFDLSKPLGRLSSPTPKF